MAAASDANPATAPNPVAASAATASVATAETVTTAARPGVGNILFGRAMWEAILSTPVATLVAAILTPLLAFVTLWLFAIFPWLRPWTPPQERRVSIDNAVVAERRFTLPESNQEFTVVTFDAEAVGYAANPITVATLWLDPVTGRRVEPTMHIHGNLVSSAMTNRSVGWLNVPSPSLPTGVQGCLVLRVLLLLTPPGETDPSRLPALIQPSELSPLLAYTDSTPIDVYEDGSCAALPNETLSP